MSDRSEPRPTITFGKFQNVDMRVAVVRSAPIASGTNAPSRLVSLDLGRNIDYEGASGPLDLNDIGDPSRATYDVFVYNPDGTDTTERQIQVSP